jgi:hypothetical protein
LSGQPSGAPELRLVRARPEPPRIFSVTGLDQPFSVFTTLPEALADPAGRLDNPERGHEN